MIGDWAKIVMKSYLFGHRQKQREQIVHRCMDLFLFRHSAPYEVEFFDPNLVATMFPIDSDYFCCFFESRIRRSDAEGFGGERRKKNRWDSGRDTKTERTGRFLEKLRSRYVFDWPVFEWKKQTQATTGLRIVWCNRTFFYYCGWCSHCRLLELYRV